MNFNHMTIGVMLMVCAIVWSVSTATAHTYHSPQTEDHYTTREDCSIPTDSNELKFFFLFLDATNEDFNVCRDIPVYSHSTVTFWYNGIQQTLSFNKHNQGK